MLTINIPAGVLGNSKPCRARAAKQLSLGTFVRVTQVFLTPVRP